MDLEALKKIAQGTEAPPEEAAIPLKAGMGGPAPGEAPEPRPAGFLSNPGAPKTIGDEAMHKLYSKQGNYGPSKQQRIDAGENPDWIDRTAGSFLLGMAEDPIFELALDAAGFDDERRDAMAARLASEDGMTADIFEFAGEWGPLIASSMGVWGLGRLGVRAGIKKFGKGKAKDFLTMKPLTKAELKAGKVPDLKAPGSLVWGMAGGGAVAEGTLEGVREAVRRDGDIQAAIEAGGTVGGISFALEGALLGITRTGLLGKFTGIGRRTLDSEEVKGIIDRFKSSPLSPGTTEQSLGPQSTAKRMLNELRNEEKKLTKKILGILDVNGNLRHLDMDAIGMRAARTKKFNEFLQGKGGDRRKILKAQWQNNPAFRQARAFDATTGEAIEAGKEILGKARAVAEKRRRVLADIRALQPYQEVPKGATYRGVGGGGQVAGAGAAASGIRESLTNLMVQFNMSPESALRELNVTGANFLKGAQEVEGHMEALLIRSKLNSDQWQNTLAGTLGKFRKSLTGKHKPSLKGVDDAEQASWFGVWQREGEEGISNLWREKYGRSAAEADKAVEVFQAIDKQLKRSGERLRQIGRGDNLTQRELSEAGKSKFMPIMFAGHDKNQAVKLLQKAGLTEDKISRLMEEARSGLDDLGNRGLAHLDIWKELTTNGTFDEIAKLGQGTFLTNPFHAIEADALAQGRRYYLTKLIGGGSMDPRSAVAGIRDLAEKRSTNAHKERLMQIVDKEGGDRQLFSTIYDTITGTTFYDASQRSLADTMISAQIASKLVTAVVPNLSQSGNTQLMFGTKRMVDGMNRRFGRNAAQNKEYLAGIGVLDETVTGALEQFRSTPGPMVSKMQSIAARAARFVMENTGFSHSEKWNRAISANAGVAYFRETMTLGKAGRLRGAELAKRRRIFRDLGVDLDDTLANYDSLFPKTPTDNVRAFEALGTPQGQAIEAQIAYKSMQQTQFLASPTRKPGLWNTPTGRVVTQFKSFAFNQAKLVRDVVLNEAGNGNMKPLATVLAVHPFVAGIGITASKDILHGKSPEVDYVEAVSALGGFGMVSDVVRSSGMGRLTDTIMGPTLSDATALAERSLQGDPFGAVGNWVSRQPAITLAWGSLARPAYYGVLQMEEALANSDEEDLANTGAIDSNKFYSDRKVRE